MATLPRLGDIKFTYGISWPVVGWFAFVHAGALLAPFYITWGALGVFLALSLSGGLGITMGYHRLFTHQSFRCGKPLRYLLGLMGTLAGEGPIIEWVATHRLHHQKADAPGDPHSPRDGLLWAHILWMLPSQKPGFVRGMCNYFAPDLTNEPAIVKLNAAFLPLQFLLAAGLWVSGGMPWLIWGMFVRTVWVWHSTWAVNSLTHRFGYRNYVTDDDSTNILWLTPFTLGESNHNNHHAKPRAADHGQRWFEFDPTYRLIRLLETVGLVWHVVRSNPNEARTRRRLAA